jgi:hypothetical protein
VLLGLVGLAAAVPFSAPDGTGMQWDELVLGGVAASAVWALFRRARTMSRAAGRPWRLLGVAASMFTGLTTIADGVDTPELRAGALAVGAEYVAGRAAPEDLRAEEVTALLAVPA